MKIATAPPLFAGLSSIADIRPVAGAGVCPALHTAQCPSAFAARASAAFRHAAEVRRQACRD